MGSVPQRGEGRRVTDKRLPSKAALAQVRARYAHESSDDPATWRSPSDAPEVEQALRIDLSRCIEVLERLAAPSRSFGYDQDAGCQSRMGIAESLLRELHGEGEA